jgi:hypothetical protein
MSFQKASFTWGMPEPAVHPEEDGQRGRDDEHVVEVVAPETRGAETEEHPAIQGVGPDGR